MYSLVQILGRGGNVMRSLVNGCAAAALLLGMAYTAQAEVVVRDAPVHALPTDDGAPAVVDAADDDVAVVAPPKAPVASPAPAEVVKIEAVDQAKAEPAMVKALIQPKAPPAPALTPDESAFFTVLGQRVTDAASAYESYVRRAGAIDPAFTGGASVHKAVTASAAYRPQQLDEGIVAYAALIALRNPAFVDGVRSIRDPAFADSLTASPDQVMRVPGSAEAATDAANVLRAQGAALIASGKAISKAAYDIQVQAWSKTPVADPRDVLDGAKLSAEQTRVATIPSKERLLASLVAAPQAPAATAGSSAPDVVRGLALAALAIMGRTGDGKEAAYEALLRDPAGIDCLKMAKLNLNQCLAVAGPQYEDVYCVGRHAVSDTGKCVTAAAVDNTAPAALPAAAPPRLEQAQGYGREQAEAYGQAQVHDADDDDVAQPIPGPRYAVDSAPRQAPPTAAYAQNDYPPQQQPASYPAARLYQPQQQPYPAAPQYQPQQPSYPAQAYPAPPYPAQSYAAQANAQQQPVYGGQSYYQPYGYAARSYYGR